jgi:hypothetical protein
MTASSNTMELILANDVSRIGPRKLSRVLRYARDSTIIRQPGDYGSRSSRAHEPSPTTIRGDTSWQSTTNQYQDSYFELQHQSEARSPNSLITPISFMDASLADSPKGPAASDRDINAFVEHPASNADCVRGDKILLVEDNAFNMRVSLSHFGWRPTSAATSVPVYLDSEHARLSHRVWYCSTYCQKLWEYSQS